MEKVGELIVGLASTVNPLASEPVPPSPLVTVTVRAPVLAPDSTATLADSSVALTKLVDSTEMPVPENSSSSAPPLTKPLPLMVIVVPLAP